MKNTTTFITPMGIEYDVEAYQPLFDFQTTSSDWLKAIVWAGIFPMLIFGFIGSIWTIAYFLFGAGLYGVARNFTPVSVMFYILAFMSIGWWIMMGLIILSGAALAAFGG